MVGRESPSGKRPAVQVFLELLFGVCLGWLRHAYGLPLARARESRRALEPTRRAGNVASLPVAPSAANEVSLHLPPLGGERACDITPREAKPRGGCPHLVLAETGVMELDVLHRREGVL